MRPAWRRAVGAWAAVAVVAACHAPVVPGAEADRVAELEARVAELERRLAQVAGESDRLLFLQRVYDIADQTARVRGLEFKHDIRPYLITRPDLADYLQRLVGSQYSVQQARDEAFRLALLDLAPDGVDMLGASVAGMGDNLAGFYNDRDESLFVVAGNDLLSVYGQVTLAHEICHALQDQHYNLGRLSDGSLNSDHALALRAVVEGDATMLMREWADEYSTGEAIPLSLVRAGALTDTGPVSGAELPERDVSFRNAANVSIPALGQETMFPYAVGLAFMERLRDSGVPGWREMPFAAMPESTEQVLHFDRYYPRMDPPRQVTLPYWVPRDGMHQVVRDTMGEFSTRLFLTLPADYGNRAYYSRIGVIEEPVATRGAAGWGGDQIAVFANTDRSRWLLAWGTEWDSPLDAEEFVDALVRRMRAHTRLRGWERREMPAPDIDASAVWSRETRDAPAAFIGHEGEAVRFLFASDLATLRVGLDWWDNPPGE